MASHEMVCICSPEGKNEAIERWLEVCRRLQCEPAQLSWAVTLSLAWQFGAELDCASDMWSGVGLCLGERSEYIECDLPIDGYCYLWLLLANELGDDQKLVRGTFIDMPAVLARVEKLETEYDRLGKQRTSHKQMCNVCSEDPWVQCAFAKDLWNEQANLSSVRCAFWGEPEFDSAREWYGRPYDE